MESGTQYQSSNTKALFKMIHKFFTEIMRNKTNKQVEQQLPELSEHMRKDLGLEPEAKNRHWY
ncbi:hypothetical protein FXE63_15630 [Vibrio mimicus]|nr:hypothetical protein FXE63_15630 [Vibrio mimicus]